MQHVNLASVGDRSVNLQATIYGSIMEHFLGEFWLMSSGFTKGIFLLVKMGGCFWCNQLILGVLIILNDHLYFNRNFM